jgi:hypothetical protein
VAAKAALREEVWSALTSAKVVLDAAGPDAADRWEALPVAAPGDRPDPDVADGEQPQRPRHGRADGGRGAVPEWCGFGGNPADPQPCCGC